MRTVVVGGGEEVALPAGSAPTLAEKKKVTAKPKKVGCHADCKKNNTEVYNLHLKWGFLTKNN